MLPAVPFSRAQSGTRTHTACAIRPSSVRVYQFHHLSYGKRGKKGNLGADVKRQNKQIDLWTQMG